MKLANILFFVYIAVCIIGMFTLGILVNTAWYYGDLKQDQIQFLVLFWGTINLLAGLMFGYWKAKEDFKQIDIPYWDSATGTIEKKPEPWGSNRHRVFVRK